MDRCPLDRPVGECGQHEAALLLFDDLDTRWLIRQHYCARRFPEDLPGCRVFRRGSLAPGSRRRRFLPPVAALLPRGRTRSRPPRGSVLHRGQEGRPVASVSPDPDVASPIHPCSQGHSWSFGSTMCVAFPFGATTPPTMAAALRAASIGSPSTSGYNERRKKCL